MCEFAYVYAYEIDLTWLIFVKFYEDYPKQMWYFCHAFQL